MARFCTFFARYVEQARLCAITRIRLLWLCGSQPFSLAKAGCWFHGLTISYSLPGTSPSSAPVCHSWASVFKLYSAVYLPFSVADDIAGQFFNENGVRYEWNEEWRNENGDLYLLSQQEAQVNLRFVRELWWGKIEAWHSGDFSCFQSTNIFPSEWWKGK